MPRSGRPQKEVDLGQVESLAAQGLTNDQIALSIGISRSNYFKKKAESLDFQDAVKRGQAKGIAKVTNSLFQAANNGNITAQIFYLKNRDPQNWRDKQDVEHSGDVNIHVSSKDAQL